MINEFLTGYAGLHIPLIAISYAVVFGLYLMNGRPTRFLSTPFARPWIAFMGWLLVTSVLSDYPGRSLPYMLGYGTRLHTLPFVLCGVATSVLGLRKLMYSAGLGAVAVMLFCLKFGEIKEQRFFIPKTSLENPNDLALRLLLYGVLFLIFLGAGNLGRILVLVCLPIMASFILKTGSRANLLTMSILILVSLIMLPAQKKMMILAIAVLISALAVPFLPGGTTARLFTLFESSGGSSMEEAVLNSTAVDSTNARLQLQERAIQLTTQHLVFGVGPGNFEDAVEEMVRDELGIKSGWQVAHNSYLQVSAETGLPGLALYVWCIGLCLLTNYRAFRATTGNQNLLSFCLFLCCVVYAVGVLFCSIPFEYYLSLLVGFSSANFMILKDKIVKPSPGPAAANPLIAPGRVHPVARPAFSGN